MKILKEREKKERKEGRERRKYRKSVGLFTCMQLPDGCQGGTGSPRSGVTEGCELSNVGAGTQIHVIGIAERANIEPPLWPYPCLLTNRSF